jgi:4-hydroxybutyrate dehydrogenase
LFEDPARSGMIRPGTPGMKPPTISYLADVWFEPGASALLAGVLEKLKVTRPLIVSDPGVVAAGLLEPLHVRELAAPVFDRVDPNPTEANVLAGLEAYRAHQCDGVVAVGGGSPLDCGKCVALLATHPPPLRQYAYLEGGPARITAKQPPFVAIPTTAGTGSEVGRGALITFADRQKLALLSPHLIPDAAICDPDLTLGLPPLLTAATGMDAISHCVETFCSPRFNPVAEAIALDGLKRAWEHLPRAVNDGGDREARSEMLTAAMEGGLTVQKGLGAVHALSHPLGGLPGKRLHHGTLNAIFMPHVLRFNAAACPDKMRRMGEVIGVPGGAIALADALQNLARGIGLPPRLRDLGVTWQELDSLQPAALRDHCGATNPRPLDARSVESLFRAAY